MSEIFLCFALCYLLIDHIFERKNKETDETK